MLRRHKIAVLKPKIIIAALSSRAYVQAAVNAGFDVLAIDGFCDVDTQKLAFEMHKISFDERGFNALALLNTLEKLDLKGFQGMCYGAGFEAQPSLLAKIAKRIPVLGNNAETVAHCKNPQLFQALCHAFDMPTPTTSFKRPASSLGWVSKQIGACGGAHIKPLLPLDLPQSHPVYYQQISAGTPISCLFLADGVHAEVIGFSEQWCSPTAVSPYRYGGAVSHAFVQPNIKEQIEVFIKGLTFKLGLRGINSIDFLIEGNRVLALEINPRLSATLDLYTAKRGNFFTSHVQACLAQLSDWPLVKNVSKAHHIIYANKAAKVPADIEWDDWVCDIPQPSSAIAAGMPICTVTAEAHTAKLAKDKVLRRAEEL